MTSVAPGRVLTLQQFQFQFNVVLARVLAKRLVAVSGVTKDVFILKAIRYVQDLALAGGKRLRPYLAYLAYASRGGKKIPQALQLFTAIEIYHLFCLIQDDIIDHGLERHGIRTLHEEVRGRQAQQNRTGDLRHVSESEAMLIADLLASWSTDIVERCADFPSPRLTVVRSLFRTLREEVIIGELLDVDTMTRPTIPTKLIREKMVIKTARYSFVRPLQIGFALAGQSRQHLGFAERFGQPLGVAFQVQDDLFDVCSDSQNLGKSVLSDLRQHEHTILTQYILTDAPYLSRKQLLHWFGGDVEPRDIGAIREVFERSGAVAFARALVATEFAKATKVLQKSGLPPVYRSAFASMLETIEHRSS